MLTNKNGNKLSLKPFIIISAIAIFGTLFSISAWKSSHCGFFDECASGYKDILSNASFGLYFLSLFITLPLAMLTGIIYAFFVKSSKSRLTIIIVEILLITCIFLLV